MCIISTAPDFQIYFGVFSKPCVILFSLTFKNNQVTTLEIYADLIFLEWLLFFAKLSKFFATTYSPPLGCIVSPNNFPELITY